MTLRIIEPFAITQGNIDSTNVALETAWTAGTYTLGDVRRVGERLFEVSAASTTQEPGLAASTEWFDAGPANRYAAFDLQFGADKFRVIDTITERADSITYTLTGLPRLSAMVFFGLRATQITIVGTLNTTGGLAPLFAGGQEGIWLEVVQSGDVADVTYVFPDDVADVTYDVPDATSYLGSFWRWFFAPQSLERTYAAFDLSIPIGATVEVTITNAGFDAAVGTIAMGIADEYGDVEVASTRGLRSRSVKKTEGTLTSLLRRTPAAKVGYRVHLNDYAAAPFWRTIDDLDGVAAVFAGPDDNPEFLAYGFVSSCQTVSEVRGITKVQLEVETL
jgi:hypothetical protein